MTYASRQDLVARFGADEIDDVDPDAGEGEDPRYPKSAAVLADAAAEIDGVLAHAYDLPLPGDQDRATDRYPLLAAIACDIARHRLYDEEEPEAVKERATRARAKLQAISTGRYVLVNAVGTVAARRSEARVVSRERSFEGAAASGRIEGLDGF